MSTRTERIASVIQEILSFIFQKRLARNSALITISFVEVSSDLGTAYIYISVIGLDIESVIETLNEKKKELRKELAWQVRNQFKRIPELVFYPDKRYDATRRIETLLQNAKKRT